MENILWYGREATCFEEALPIGNGSLGGMVYGKNAVDRISLNLDTLWTGKPTKKDERKRSDIFKKIQKLALDGDLVGANDTIDSDFWGLYSQSYLPMGNLYVELENCDGPSSYHRRLDMRRGIVSVVQVQWIKGNSIRREYFTSYPDGCLAVHISANNPISFSVSLDSQLKNEIYTLDEKLIMQGECPSIHCPHYARIKLPTEYDGEGIKFATAVKAVGDGTIVYESGKLMVCDAKETTLLLCAESSYIDFRTLPTKECLAPCLERIDVVASKGYKAIKADHIGDFSSYYDRVKLDLGLAESPLPTDERIRADDKFGDLGLVELLFNYGRYLAISSSREGSMATNLQGIWNEHITPPWSCNYTLDINTQMNYWPMNVCNMPELNEPLFELIENISISGAETARNLYDAKGFCCHSTSDIWGHTAIGGFGYKNMACCSFWPLSAAWLCRHLWEYYEYTLDVEFLKNTAYPLMKGAAEFLLSLLIEVDGKHVVCPSVSPENLFYLGDEKLGLAKHTAMSQGIVIDLFTAVSRAAKLLGIEDEFTAEINEKLPMLNTYEVGSEGRLLEFDREYTEVDPHHRHASHLYGLYPGDSITTDTTPELAEACRVTLEKRGDYSTGWAMGWRVNFWAKLKDGDRALKLILNQLNFVDGSDGEISYGGDGGTYPNLLDAHPPFQIDGNFGVCAGITQMLLQCEDGKIKLLPALPASFKRGSVSGLRAKGNITVDMEWCDGKLVSYELTSPIKQMVTVVTPDGEFKVEVSQKKEALPTNGLYGDGIHDDTDAIQALIDSGVSEVSLPMPQKCYLISKPLVIPSNFKLKLPRNAEVKLADGSDCFMLQSKVVRKLANRLSSSFREWEKKFWFFVDEYSPDFEDACHDFEIEGGIWNYNNRNQKENPILTSNFTDEHYLGHLMFFYNVRNFKLSNMTFKDPANYAVMIDRASHFVVENIDFDFNYGNPMACNMDGIHLDGNCHFGVIKNLRGACFDDLVALNAHEGSSGDITNIEIDGLYVENSHSAVRLLTVKDKIEHISISNVYGTYYQYCIGFTKYYPGETTGHFDAITLSDIHASKSKRYPIQEAHMGDKSYHFPLIWIQDETFVKSLVINRLFRREYANHIDTIHVGKNAVVENITVNGLFLENHTDSHCPKFVNRGHIKELVTDSLVEDDIKTELNHPSTEH